VPLLMATSELLWLNCSRERMSRLVFYDLHVSVPFMLQKHETGGGRASHACVVPGITFGIVHLPIGGFPKALPTTADSILHSSDICCPFA
jgi:hypothetical protein